MPLTATTWVTVADAGKASFLLYQGLNRDLVQVDNGLLEHAHPPSRDINSERPGRAFNSADDRRSAMANPTDAHEHEKEEFAREISAFLTRRQNEFDHMVLAAPPKMLGFLRQHMDASVKQKITAELPKDLSQMPYDQLPKHLSGVLNF